jgi:hypothetical protein
MNIYPITRARSSKAAGSSAGTVCPVPDGARFVVTIDGKPYAGFLDRSYAEQAVGLWLGEIDGAGLPVPAQDREKRAWPAIRGRNVQIIER